MLLQTGDKELLRQYLLEEYRTSRLERTETRRHQSLDDDMENGIDYEDKQGRQLPFSFSDIEDNSLFEAIQQLTPRQKEMLHLVYFVELMKAEAAFEVIFFPTNKMRKDVWWKVFGMYKEEKNE